jgi:glycosyltransferase involved in cell wall biosynthesis
VLVRVSVVVPAFNAERTLGDCLRALRAQSYTAADLEIIVVDDGSRDGTAPIAQRNGVRVIRRQNGGPGAARNTGWRAARGDWVAFTDADCVPSRTWLAEMMRAVEPAGGPPPALGAAGATFGFDSKTPAARYVDLSGGLDAKRHLSHPLFPFAPSGNLLYRREALARSGGFDERYRTYEACELHQRLRARDKGEFVFAPRAVVLHRHRTTWAAYWRQQHGYGIGYGQFMLHHAARISWSFADELRAWGDVVAAGIGACRPGGAERRLVDLGTFVKRLAQRTAFTATYWNVAERARW